MKKTSALNRLHFKKFDKLSRLIKFTVFVSNAAVFLWGIYKTVGKFGSLKPKSKQ